MPSVGFEPTISAGERPQTYALGRAATGTGKLTLGNRIENVCLRSFSDTVGLLFASVALKVIFVLFLVCKK